MARRVRELVGDDGEEICEYMFSVMKDNHARHADRLDAARWLADRGFGRAVQGLEIDLAQRPALDLSHVSDDDLALLLEIVDRSGGDGEATLASGQFAIQQAQGN